MWCASILIVWDLLSVSPSVFPNKWYQSSNLRAMFATFIMAKIVDPSKNFISPYHVSSQQHMICSLGIQQERQVFYNQSKVNIDTSRRSYGKRYTSKVCSHCGRTRHVIDTCHRKHGFPPQFKFKNQKVNCNSNQQNHIIDISFLLEALYPYPLKYSFAIWTSYKKV